MSTPAVQFVYADWVAMFPAFAACSPAQGAAWFDLADSYFENDTCNPVFRVSAARFARYLYMLTSHIAWLNAPRDADGNPAATGQMAPNLVGRINSAAEGSVNVGVELNASGSPSEAFFSQTEWGLMFWQATSQFRTMRYSARPTRIFNGTFPSTPYGRVY
jgi:hypothetical protein